MWEKITDWFMLVGMLLMLLVVLALLFTILFGICGLLPYHLVLLIPAAILVLTGAAIDIVQEMRDTLRKS